MNIAGIQWDCTNIYDGVAVEIYVSGCTLHCPGCQNPELQNFNYGKPLIKRELIEELLERKEWFDIVSILGGDLLCQGKMEALHLVNSLRLALPDKKFWLFTGFNQEELPEWPKFVFDVIKTGRYIQEYRQENAELITSNQKLLKKGVDY